MQLNETTIKKILITGATGNIGIEVIDSLIKLKLHSNIIAGVRDLKTDKEKLGSYKIDIVKFDFTDTSSFQSALKGCDILFLLRPPNISEVEKYFKPLIKKASEAGIKHIVFLSVQGVERSKIIPHYKIEKLIVESKIAYTFLRPAYFMQNFTTSLNDDLVKKKKIFLPAGNSKFTLVDVRDIGAVAAVILTNPERHVNSAYELTSNEKLTFKEMAIKLSEGLGEEIKYESPNLLKFYLVKRKEKMPAMLIFVMIMLHYLPRFQKEPAITPSIKELIGEQPITFEQFISDNKIKLCPDK